MLENEVVRVLFDPETGAIVSLFDKRQQADLLTGPMASGLFRVIAPDGACLSNHFDAEKATASMEGNTATFTYETPNLVATVRLELIGPAILTTLQLQNRSVLTLEEIQFPRLTGLKPIPNGMITLPNFGRRRFDPLGPELSGDRRHAEQYLAKMTARYPERMVTAWCDYASDRHGIALEARHTDFSIVDFMVAKTVNKKTEPVARTLDLVAAHPRRVMPGESWESPPMRLFVHEGDWHAVADAHREWVETWLPKRTPVRMFTDSVGWHYFFLKHQDGSNRFTYDDIPRMAEAALGAGCPYLLLFGWHAPGHDNHYCYQYVPNEEWGGAAALRGAIEKARAMGVNVIPFFNGTLANVNTPEHRAFGHRWEAHTRENAPYYAGDWAGFTVDVPSSSRGRMHHELCPVSEHRVYFLESLRRIVSEYGFGNIQLDQIAIKMMPCYNAEHGHNRPDRAFTDGIASLLRDTRTFLDNNHPGGMMLSECTNEFTGQWCDGAWTWDFFENPEPILYSCPWLLTSTAIDAMEFAETNRAFVHKIMLDLRIAGGDELISEYPAYAEHVRSLADLKRRTQKYYADASFRDREGIEEVDTTGDGSVIARVFRNQTEKTASVAVAETSGSPVEVRIRLDDRCAGNIKRESSSGSSDPVTVQNGFVSFRLNAHEAVLLCIDLG